MPGAQHPLHRSMHAALPHTVLASGRGDQTLVRVRQPVRDDLGHALPAEVIGLTAAAQGAMPQPADLQPEHPDARPIVRDAKVARVPRHHRAQVLTLLGNGSVHAPSQFVLHGVQLGPQPLGTGDPQDPELALPGRAADRPPRCEVARPGHRAQRPAFHSTDNTRGPAG